MSRETGTRWVFTLNNYSLAEEPKIWFDNGEIQYLIWKPERAPTTNTPHLQGYLVLKPNPRNKNGRGLPWMKKNINGRADWRVARGSHQQCVDYVSKEETADGPVTELGEYTDGRSANQPLAAREKKKDMLNEVRDLIVQGATDQQLWMSHFKIMMHHHRALSAFRLSLPQAQRDHQTKLIVITGPSGTGKSHLARRIATAQCGGGYYLAADQNGKVWMDGYDPARREHDWLIMEEFTGATMRPTLLLRLADKYPVRLETKGSSVEVKFKGIIITTNKLPRDLWSEEAMNATQYAAFMRRCDGENGCIIHMTEPYVADIPPSFSMKDIIEDLATGKVDENNKPVSQELEHEYEEATDSWNDEEVDEIDQDDLDYQEDDLNYEIDANDARDFEDERYMRATAPLGTSQHTIVSGGTIEISPDPELEDALAEAADEQVAAPPAAKRIKRTDKATFGLEKIVDKRWGKQPTQAKIVLNKAQSIQRQDDDDDFDDK